MDTREAVREWLEAHGCDGLASGECSCWLDDLVPCGRAGRECRAAKAAEYRASDV